MANRRGGVGRGVFIASGPISQQKVEDPFLLKGFNWRVQDCILQLFIGNGVVSIQMLKLLRGLITILINQSNCNSSVYRPYVLYSCSDHIN